MGSPTLNLLNLQNLEPISSLNGGVGVGMGN